MAHPSNLTLMAVHAHPDDESSSTGGVLARCALEGVKTVLVTCTNGEYGDGPNHVKPGQEGHDPDQVAKIRRAELEEACELLGVNHLEMLGYHDSGMPDWQYKDQRHVFHQVPLEDPVGRLVALVEQYRPHVLVTYNEMGGYGHPDHQRAHEITLEAFARTNSVSKLYLIARRRGMWEKLRQSLEAAGVELPPAAQPTIDPEFARRLEEAEQRITTVVDIAAVAEKKRAALAAHASQLDQSWFVQIPDDAFLQAFGEETFIRAADTTGASLPETDLFAGLR